MKLYELEDQLRRMREQSCDSNTEVDLRDEEGYVMEIESISSIMTDHRIIVISVDTDIENSYKEQIDKIKEIASSLNAVLE